MERYDLLLTPTLPIAAFDVGKLAPVDDGKASGCTGRRFPIPST
jgi:Asp-tRNA(Asn)/Glu-tRNA(Gln) amidotransferase A subunit family amidase